MSDLEDVIENLYTINRWISIAMVRGDKWGHEELMKVNILIGEQIKKLRKTTKAGI